MNLPFYGTSIVNEDDKNLKKIIQKNDTRRIITFSIKNKKSNVFVDKIHFDNQYSYFTLNINFSDKKFYLKEEYHLMSHFFLKN